MTPEKSDVLYGTLGLMVRDLRHGLRTLRDGGCRCGLLFSSATCHQSRPDRRTTCDVNVSRSCEPSGRIAFVARRGTRLRPDARDESSLAVTRYLRSERKPA